MKNSKKEIKEGFIGNFAGNFVKGFMQDVTNDVVDRALRQAKANNMPLTVIKQMKRVEKEIAELEHALTLI